MEYNVYILSYTLRHYLLAQNASAAYRIFF